jgi:hypothetical protein
MLLWKSENEYSNGVLEKLLSWGYTQRFVISEMYLLYNYIEEYKNEIE